MKCKDISDRDVLEFVWDVNQADRWGNNSFGNDADVRRAMPGGLDIPWKLAWAKMNQLIKRKLVDGCPCGCRGDYVVTAKGCEFIERPRHRRFVGDQHV